MGAISSYLNKLITNPRYNQLAKDFQGFVRRLPKGELALKLAHKAEEGFRGALNEVGMQQTGAQVDADGRGGHGSPVLFEEMGVRYLGPIDGHDLPLLISTLEFAKTCDHPIVIHVLTKKGKGYEAAIKSPEKFHGTGPYDVKTGDSAPGEGGHPAELPQDVFGQTMVKICPQRFHRGGHHRRHAHRHRPQSPRESHARTLLRRGHRRGTRRALRRPFKHGPRRVFHPVCAIYSSFLQRAYDCIHHDVCLQDLPVIFCMDRSGLSANDGPTHHGVFDIAYLRCMPNVIAMAPANEDELADMMFTATHEKHPTFIRYPRGARRRRSRSKNMPRLIEIGKAEVVQNFSSATATARSPSSVLGPMCGIARNGRRAANR